MIYHSKINLTSTTVLYYCFTILRYNSITTYLILSIFLLFFLHSSGNVLLSLRLHYYIFVIHSTVHNFFDHFLLPLIKVLFLFMVYFAL